MSIVDIIIKHTAFQKLKKIRQNGGAFLVYPNIKTSRFQHCIETARILAEKGAGQEEIIVGLLHDCAHGPFSHVIDRISPDYHEIYLNDYLKRSGLAEIIQHFGFDPEKISQPSQYPVVDSDPLEKQF